MERWVVAAKRADFAAIGKEFGIDPVIARLIRNRDVQDRDEITQISLWNGGRIGFSAFDERCG